MYGLETRKSFFFYLSLLSCLTLGWDSVPSNGSVAFLLELSTFGLSLVAQRNVRKPVRQEQSHTGGVFFFSLSF